MAEVLLLLVFLLLLSMAALLLRKDREQDALRVQLGRSNAAFLPLTNALASRGMIVRETDELVSLIERGSEAQRLRSELQEIRKRLDVMQAAAAEQVKATAETAVLAATLERQHEAEIDHMQTALTQAQQKLTAAAAQQARASADSAAVTAILERVPGPQDTKEKLERLVQKAASADAGNSSIIGQNTQMRQELARLKGNGGSGLPYCWALPDGAAQYMLKVEMQDNGVIVHDLEPRARPQDSAWSSLDPIARGQLMPLADFMGQVAPLQAKAASDRCRYSIQVVDGTARTNKPGYKQSMGRLWTAFNIREVSQ